MPHCSLQPNQVKKSSAIWRVICILFSNFVVYFLIGVPLAVFPSLVHLTLGYSAVVAGGLIGLQYAATLLMRAPLGKIADSMGAKSVVLGGLCCAVLSGGCILIAAICIRPGAILVFLGLSRLFLGAAESGTGTGCIAWGIGRVGVARTALVISLSGIASYGGIALGAPFGVLLNSAGGLPALGLFTAGFPVLGFLLCLPQRAVPAIAGARMKIHRVFQLMLPFGVILALASAGFGTIISFIQLDFSGRGWNGAAYALALFGFCFVAVRLAFTGAIHRLGGFAAATASLCVEIFGLLALWLAHTSWEAMLGASLSGLGLSLIFPAIAVEGLKAVPVTSRGAAIGAYAVFLDLSLGLTGPIAGLLISGFGYASVFFAAALAAGCALGMTRLLRYTASGEAVT